jgi:hypothetical protein
VTIEVNAKIATISSFFIQWFLELSDCFTFLEENNTSYSKNAIMDAEVAPVGWWREILGTEM